MATLRKSHGKYYIRTYAGGKEKWLPTGTSSMSEAERHLKRFKKNELDVKQRLKDEVKRTDENRTIQECIDYFLKHYKTETGITESTFKSYRLAVNDFKNAFISFRNIQDVKDFHYPRLLEYLKSCEYKDTTINIRLRGIRVFLNYLYQRKYSVRDGVPYIPFSVKEIKVEKKIYDKYFTPEQLRKFYDQISNPKHLATFKILEITGMRVGEFPYTRREGNQIIIQKSKNKKERKIPINPAYIPVYDLAMNPPYARNTIIHLFIKYADRAGIQGKSCHCFRHTYAHRMLEQTKNLMLVKEILGHSSTRVTEIYVDRVTSDEYLNDMANIDLSKFPNC